MMILRPTLCLAPLAVAACATAPQGAAGPNPQVVAQLTSQAADQVKRCYKAPRLSKAARQITTRLRVRFMADGQLADYPVLLSQSGVTPANRAHAPAMAEAAMAAVVRCAPLRLPADFHQAGWDEFDLTFSPRVFA